MSNDFITIQEATALSQKSTQTIRRAIKSKKLKTKKERTPQGFNYLVSRESLIDIYKIKNAGSTGSEESVPTGQKTSRASSRANRQPEESHFTRSTNEVIEFHKTLQELIKEHSQERQNYLRLIQSMQEKLVALENKFNLLQTTASKRWFHFWK